MSALASAGEPVPPRAVPAACLILIRDFERGPSGDFAAHVYRDPAGVDTIGWGHRVWPGDRLMHQVITREQADALAEQDLMRAAAGVCRVLPPNIVENLTDGQYAALVDFTFNLGEHALAGSTLVHDILAGRMDLIPTQLERWIYSRGKIWPGLQRRRAAEAALWLA